MISSELNKAIHKESKELTKHFKVNDNSELTYRISPVKVKASMEKSVIKDNPIHEFTPEFQSFLINFRKYLIEDVDKLKMEFDPKTGKKERENFKKTWNDYLSHEIIFETKTLKKLKLRILTSIFGGLLMLSACICFALLAFFYETSTPLQITYIVFNNLLFTFSWVFIWQGFSFLVYDYKPRKKKRRNLFVMYKAQFVVGASYAKYKKVQAKQKIDPIEIEEKPKE